MLNGNLQKKSQLKYLAKEHRFTNRCFFVEERNLYYSIFEDSRPTGDEVVSTEYLEGNT